MFRTILTAALLLLPSLAHADWYEASSAHFVVYSELPPARLTAFATKLERFDAVMRWLRQNEDETIGPANRITVYMVDDQGDVAKLAADRGVAGFYVPRAGGSLAIVPRSAGESESDLSAQAILFHEYAHHLMWSFSPDAVYPAWYIEGWAETLATAKFYDDGAADVGRPPQYRAFGLMLGNALPIQMLLVADTLKLNDLQREGLYGRGWLLTHYLLFSGQRKGQLDAYLRAINDGKPAMEAAKAFGNLAALDKELERYKTGKLKALRLPADKIKVGGVKLRKLTPGEAATMAVRIRSKVGVNDKTAPGVFARARKAAAGFPDDRGAQLVLAEAAFDAKDYSVAEAAADAALKDDPSAVDGYVYKAMVRMALAEKAGDKTPESWKGIRRIIAAGNKIDPDDPEPLILYYRSFLESGTPPTDTAKLGLRRAFELCPQDDGLRFSVATMYLRDGNKQAARTLMAPLAYQPHGQGIAAMAATLIALIDKGDIDAALKTLDGKDKEDDESANKKG